MPNPPPCFSFRPRFPPPPSHPPQHTRTHPRVSTVSTCLSFPARACKLDAGEQTKRERLFLTAKSVAASSSRKKRVNAPPLSPCPATAPPPTRCPSWAFHDGGDSFFYILSLDPISWCLHPQDFASTPIKYKCSLTTIA
jgi:hypothetical protein